MKWHCYHSIYPGKDQLLLYSTIRASGGWDNWTMHVIEWLPECITRRDLVDIEMYYIQREENPLLNVQSFQPRRVYIPVDPIDYIELNTNIKKPAYKAKLKSTVNKQSPRVRRWTVDVSKKTSTMIFWLRYFIGVHCEIEEDRDYKPSYLYQCHKTYCETTNRTPFTTDSTFGIFFTKFLTCCEGTNIGIVKRKITTDEGYENAVYTINTTQLSNWLDQYPLLTI
jgi:hypothetical protein